MKIVVLAQAFACAYLLSTSYTAAAGSGSAPPRAPSANNLSPAAPIAAGSTVDPAQAQPVVNPINEYTNIVWQAAEQNRDITASTANTFDAAGAGAPPWFLRLLGAFFIEVGSVIAKWIHDFVVHCEAPAAGTLALVLQQRVFNPNVAASNPSGAGFDTIAPQVRRLNVLVYMIAQDLLLLIFILSIWKAWARGGGANLVSPVVRLAFTTALLLGWPTISAFIIEISNEMIRAIYPASGTADAIQLARGLQAVIDMGIDAAGAALVAMLSPLATTVLGAVSFGGIGADAGNIVGQSISFVALLIFTVLATALIFQLIYIVTMQSAQTALLYAQYIFAPFFLLFFAHPDTEAVAVRYIRAVVEASIWSFVWVGLLRLLVIFMTSPNNVWGEILYAVAVFQLMIHTPEFVAQAHISELSEFVSAGIFSRRTVMLMRSFSTQAREHGMMIGKAFIKEQKARAAADEDDSPASAISPAPRRRRSSRAAAVSDVATEQQFSGLQQTIASDLPPPAAAPKRRQIAKLKTNNGSADFQTGTEFAGSPVPGFYAIVHETGDTDIGVPTDNELTYAAPPAVRTNFEPEVFKSEPDIASGAADPLVHRFSPPAPLPERTNGVTRKLNNIEHTPISYRNQGDHQLIIDAKGKLRIKTAAGAPAAEIERLHSIAQLAKLSISDPQGRAAALQAATAAGEILQAARLNNKEPNGALAAVPPSGTQDNPVAPPPNLTIIKYAIAGAQSYTDAQPGNAYCTYLHNRFGNPDLNNNASTSIESSPHLSGAAPDLAYNALPPPHASIQ